jgi:hypothetical protein
LKNAFCVYSLTNAGLGERILCAISGRFFVLVRVFCGEMRTINRLKGRTNAGFAACEPRKSEFLSKLRESA